MARVVREGATASATPLGRRRRVRRHHQHNRGPVRWWLAGAVRGRGWRRVAGWLRGPGAVHAGQRLRGPWGRQTSAAISTLHVAAGPSPRSCAIVVRSMVFRLRVLVVLLPFLPLQLPSSPPVSLS